MNMKKLSLFVVLAAMVAVTNTFAQTYKPTFGTKLVLAGGGTDIVNTLTMQAPALGAAYTLTLPVDDGNANQVLQTNGSGVTTWATAILSGGSAGGDLTGTYPNPTIATTAGPNIVAALNSSGVANSLNADVLKYNSTLVVATNQLGINLGNANAWTATQTLPATAAQGDALITSVNAGTTNIGDARVADALTISGGTINNTPIGATTASTGRFTTITGTTLPSGSTSGNIVTSNAGALETRTLASLAGTIGVSTNTTLTGDGTTGTPLGINLGNANTWTATQTFPTTAGQGNALIASVNAGTAGGINANMIGNGLTDAQVVDALTISGGTINNTPIGATTASTGRFTTITGTTLPSGSTSGNIVTSNAGALETRTLASLAGTIGVSTNATLTGDGTTGTPLGINLANANTWTATQTLPTTAAQGDALIASVNAGTTNIGDARVADALTISGGTVNSTPVGATTPSTGAFTTLSASGTTTLSSFATAGIVHNAAGGALSSSLIVNADVDAAAAIAYSKLANTSAGSVLLGRGAGAGGAVQEVTLGSNLSMTGTVLNTTGVASSSEPYLTIGNTAGLSAERGIAVNSTLTGTDGGANASYTLGLNLANANSWTAAQTFSSVDINGGTIDGTSIGASSASTAIFTTTETGSLKVTGGTPAVGKVLTSNATGDATWDVSGATFTYGVSSPGSFGANQDPLAIANGSSLYRITSSAAVEVRGLTAGTAGRTVVLVNIGSNAITLTHNNAGTAANGFHLPTGNIILGPDGTVTCTYDVTTARWRVTANY
jgi:hypothetical protein